MDLHLNLWSWNVNGLRAVMNKDFAATIRREQPDWLGLQETKLQQHQIPPELEELKGYRFYWSHAERKGYSGTAVLSKIEPLELSYGFGLPEFDNEGRIIRCDYDSFIIYNIYFPNGQMNDERLDYKLRFYDACFERMEADRAGGKMVIVTGDYNTAHQEIDLANPKENEKTSGFLPRERAWLDKIVAAGWGHFPPLPSGAETLFLVELPRRAGPNVGWRIDYFFVNAEARDRVLDADIRDDIMGSDHCPVTLRISLP